ncbi:hypothetical protein [Streptacidiphilus sp. PAMC 29251]
MSRRVRRVSAAAAACLGLLVGAAGVASAAPSSSAGASAGVNAVSPTACSGVVQITAFAFHPPRVPAGQTSPAELTLKNCTAATQQVNETWLGRFSGSSTGIPAGCPVLDPFLRPVTLAPHAKTTTSTTYNYPPAARPPNSPSP